jgi:hypothetical protein
MITKRRALGLHEASRDFICRAKGRPDDQHFFRRRTRFEPILAARNAVMTGGRCDDSKAHPGSLRPHG